MSFLSILLNGYNQVDDDGVELPQRNVLNFVAGAGISLVIADNTATQATDVTITGDSGSGISTLVADVSATGPGVATATVQGIRGRTVASTTPADAALLVYDSPVSTWNPRVATGDVTLDSAGAFTVVGIQGYPVSTAAPISGYVLAWDALNGWWEPSAAGSGALPAPYTSGNVLVADGGAFNSLAMVGAISIDDGGNTDIASDYIVNAHVNTAAAIAGTKIAPAFGAQNVSATGTLTIGAGGSGASGIFGGGGTDGFAQIGTRVGGPGAAALYLLGNGGAAAAGNYVMLSSGGALEVNAISSGLYLEVGQVAYLTLASSLVALSFPAQFVTGLANPTISQADKTANSGTGETLTIHAQNETGTTSIGGTLALAGGTGTTSDGSVRINNVTNTPATPSGGADLRSVGGHLYSVNTDGDTFQLS